MTNQQLNCSKCGQVDMVQKVSAIYFGGITTTLLSGPSVGGAVPIGEGQASIGVGNITLKGGSQSLLSNRLAPPPKPSAEGMSTWAIGWGVIFLCGGILITLICLSVDGAVSILPFPLISIGIGIAILVVSCAAVVKRKTLADSQMPQWEKAVARWNDLYFCARDDGVFDPNERTFIPTHQMMDFLYR